MGLQARSAAVQGCYRASLQTLLGAAEWRLGAAEWPGEVFC